MSPQDSEPFAPFAYGDVDVDALIACVPQRERVRGFLAKNIVDHAAALGRPLDAALGRFDARAYPLVDVLRLEIAAARALHGDVPLGEGLRRIGRLAPGATLRSPVGRAMFQFFGLGLFLKTMPLGMKAAGLLARVRVDRPHDGRAVVALRGYHNVCESLAGGLEAAFTHAGHTVELRIRRLAVDDADVEMRW